MSETFILTHEQISNWNLVCTLRSVYPRVRIVVGTQVLTNRWHDITVVAMVGFPPLLIRPNGAHEEMSMDPHRAYVDVHRIMTPPPLPPLRRDRRKSGWEY